MLLRVPWHTSCVVVLLDFLTVSFTAMFPCFIELGSSLDIMVGVGCKSCFDLQLHGILDTPWIKFLHALVGCLVAGLSVLSIIIYSLAARLWKMS